MSQTYFLQSATNTRYGASAFAYIAANKDYILDAAVTFGISPGAIAGALAEENQAFSVLDRALDYYARSGFDPATRAAELATAVAGGPVSIATWLAENSFALLAQNRTHEQWLADFNAVAASGNPGLMDKLLHPVLIDAGPANIKIRTAIELVRAHGGSATFFL